MTNDKSYGLMGLDLKLKKYLNFPNGFFIEAGANDGISQSNTKIFEEFFGWRGLLVEPSISAYQKCLVNRPNSIVVNAALSSEDRLEVSGDFDGHLMSSIDGRRRNNRNNITTIKTRTLTSLLKEYNIDKVDFMSIDVEGFEIDVLRGMDFNIWKPKYILVEINGNDRVDIESILSKYGYINLINLSDFGPHNNPLWDGTHNDYLFELQHSN